jgi:hypothetical protein
MSTIDDAARAYARLRSAKTFTIDLERGKQKMTLRYSVS